MKVTFPKLDNSTSPYLDISIAQHLDISTSWQIDKLHVPYGLPYEAVKNVFCTSVLQKTFRADRDFHVCLYKKSPTFHANQALKWQVNTNFMSRQACVGNMRIL